MDVYDLAEWCCLGPLGALSIENGNRPVKSRTSPRRLEPDPGISYAFAE